MGLFRMKNGEVSHGKKADPPPWAHKRPTSTAFGARSGNVAFVSPRFPSPRSLILSDSIVYRPLEN